MGASSNVRSAAVLSAGLAVCAACVTPMHASNRSYAPDEPSSARFPGGEDEAITWLSNAFSAGGFSSQVQYGKAPNTVYVFQGLRGEIPGLVYWGRKGRAPMVGTTVQIGSVFYAYVKANDNGTATYVTLYGKPTVAGHQLCSAEDAYWSLPCMDVEAPEDWKGRAELSGATEAAAVRKLLAALPAGTPPGVSGQAIPTFLPPPTLQHPIEALEGCEWTYSTGSHFQRPFCPGGEKNVVDEDNERLLTGGLHMDPIPSH